MNWTSIYVVLAVNCLLSFVAATESATEAICSSRRSYARVLVRISWSFASGFVGAYAVRSVVVASVPLLGGGR